MIRLTVLGAVGIAVAGCAVRTPYMASPVVDMRGIDQDRYNADLSDCQQFKIKRNADTIWTNSIISDCMTARGYHVLQAGG